MSESTSHTTEDAALSAAFQAGLDAAHAEERRSADQDTAIEQAFVAGVLPDEDRRAEPIVEPIAEPLIAPEEVIPVYAWLRRGDGTEVLYTNEQIEPDADVIEQQRALREITR